MEASNRQVQDSPCQAQMKLGVSKVHSQSSLEALADPGLSESSWMRPATRALGPGADENVRENHDAGDPNAEDFLQTKTVPMVRMELPRWLPSIQAEYQSLTQQSRAVRPISDQDFDRLTKDPKRAI